MAKNTKWKIGNPLPWEKSVATLDKAPPDDPNAPLSGKVGILSGLTLDEARTKRELAAQRAAEQGVQSICDEIDAFMSPLLKSELERENARARVSIAVRKDFERFKECCAKWGLPALPAPPQAVGVFLSDMENSAADVPRLARSISVVHRACNLDDPTTDVLVRALMRQARDTINKPQTQEGTN